MIIIAFPIAPLSLECELLGQICTVETLTPSSMDGEFSMRVEGSSCMDEILCE